MNNEKISSYVGFAVKKGGVVFGLDSILACRKKIHLALYSSDIAENSLKKLLEASKKMQFCCKNFENLTETLKRNCKVLGILDKQLAQAILQNI